MGSPPFYGRSGDKEAAPCVRGQPPTAGQHLSAAWTAPGIDYHIFRQQATPPRTWGGKEKVDFLSLGGYTENVKGAAGNGQPSWFIEVIAELCGLPAITSFFSSSSGRIKVNEEAANANDNKNELQNFGCSHGQPSFLFEIRGQEAAP